MSHVEEAPSHAARQRDTNPAEVDGCRVRPAKRKFSPVTSVAEAVKRMKEVRPWHVLGKKFNRDTFSLKESQHRKAYAMDSVEPMGMTYDGNNKNANKQEKTVVVRTVPMFSIGDHSFFVDPNDPLAGGFSVTTASGKSRAREDGYVEIKFSHHTSDDAIPRRVIPQQSAALEDRPAPSAFKIPNNTIPNLFKKDEETHAEALVRAFEQKFIDESSDTIYSPCKLWIDDARRHAAWKGGQASKFIGWCSAYYSVRELKKGVQPNEIKDGMTSLRQLATKSKPAEMPKGGWATLVQDL